MKAALSIIPLFVVFIFLSAGAKSRLSPLPTSDIKQVKASEKSKINCADIPDALAEYHSLARANETAFADFLLDVTNVMYGWYDTLSPLEGKSQYITEGTFQPVSVGTQQIDELVGMAYDNSEQLSLRMENILDSIKECL